MGRRRFGLSWGGIALILAAVAAPAQATGPPIPLGFEPLEGGRGFAARAPGGAAAILPGAAVVAGRQASPVRMRPARANPHPRVVAGRRLPGVVNRLTGDPSDWRTGVPLYASVRQRAIYRGVDLVFHTRGGALEYDFVLRPGASPDRIVLAVDGARGLRLTRAGDLAIRTRTGTLRQRRPVAYQRVAGRRQEARTSFVLLGTRRFGFRLGSYDRTRPLVIDPVLAFSSYLGGSGYDEGADAATDAAGNAYVAGRTASFDFPALAGADMGCGTDAEGECNADEGYEDGRGDAFVAKLDSAGRLVWVTYIGGSTHDQGDALAVDAAGRAHVAGWTASQDFPVTAGAYRTTWPPTCDGTQECWSSYVLRLAPDGRSLQWSTLFANGFDTRIADLGVDPLGDVVLAGLTRASDFPRTPGALGTAGRAMPSFSDDAFVTRLDASGTRLDWSGAFGGERDDAATGVAIAPGGDVVIGGHTASDDFFTTAGAAQRRCDGPGRAPDTGYCDHDGFVTRVPAGGGTPPYSSYLGGNGWDEVDAVAVDPDGRPLVAGVTSAADFPATHVLTPSTYSRAFAARLPAGGGPPEWSSLIAGASTYVDAVASGTSGDIYVAGSTDNPDAIRTVNAYQGVHGGGRDGYVLRVASGGASFRWTTYLGGDAYDAVNGLASGPRGLVLAGTTTSGDYPARGGDGALGDGTCRSPYGCPADAFVARIGEGTTTPAYDRFASAKRLRAPAGYAYVDSSRATAEAGEPPHAGLPAARSVWFEWTAPVSRTVTFDTRGSGIDTVIGVYRGRTLATLAHVASNDDAPARATSRVSFTAVRGRIYRIAVDGKNGAAGLVRLAWEGAPPPNDDFLAAQPIGSTSGVATGNVVYATMEPGEPPDDYGDPMLSIWYRWTAPATGVYRFATTGSDVPAGTDIFHGQRVELLERLGWDLLSARAGETYSIRVHPVLGEIGDIRLSWRRVPRPANDDLARATAITTASGSATGETYGATEEIGEPAHGTQSRGHSVWFRWSPPVPGAYELTLKSTSYEDDLYVYEGTTYGDLKRLNVYSGSVRLGFEAGESLLVAFDLLGEYELTWRPIDAPANDLFSRPRVLAPAGGDDVFPMRGASAQAGEPSGYTGVWFTWTAPGSGPVTFDISEDIGAEGLYVYTGSAIRSLTQVGASAYDRPYVRLDATAGTTYRIRLIGSTGVRPLAWAFGRPANDDFAAARVLTGASGVATFSMAHTTPQTGEPGNPYEGTAWFTWTAPASGPATFTTAAGPADIPLDVYTGSQLATLTWVAMSQYDSARRGYVATFDAVAGTTYRIRTKGAVVGTQQLTWNRPAGESELPVAEMAYPDPGALVRGVAFLDATVFDRRGIERVDFLAGGTVIAAGSIGYGHASGYWDTRERPDGPVDVTARAVDRWGNAATSQPVRVVVDNTAPRTAIATGPTGTVTSRTARFTFSAGETAAAWSCRLDRYAWRPCAAAVTISKLSDGPHALEVRAEDLAGNIDFTPARRLWSVSGGEAQPAGAPVLAAARVR